jgi:hypothetical protein
MENIGLNCALRRARAGGRTAFPRNPQRSPQHAKPWKQHVAVLSEEEKIRTV